MATAYLEDIPGAIEFLLSINQFIFDIDAGRRDGTNQMPPAHFDAASHSRFGYLRLIGPRNHAMHAIELTLPDVSDASPQLHRPWMLANAYVST
jgi:hypothetical protein